MSSSTHAPVHPGVTFRELRGDKINQAEAARRLGWSANRMNEFEVGRRGVTAENAVMLAALTGTTAYYWMDLQARYDVWQAERAPGAKAAAARVQRI